MRRSLFLPFLVFLFALSQLGNSQDLATRDLRAAAVTQQSFLAMGGTAPTDSVAIGSIRISAGSQTEVGKIRILTRGIHQTAEHVETEQGRRAVIYAYGRAAEVEDANIRSLWMELVVTSRSALHPLIPVAAALSDADTAFQYAGRESLDGALVEHIRFWTTFTSTPELRDLSEFTVTDLWVDSASGLPRKLAYERRAAGGNAIGIPVELFYSDYLT